MMWLTGCHRETKKASGPNTSSGTTLQQKAQIIFHILC